MRVLKYISPFIQVKTSQKQFPCATIRVPPNLPSSVGAHFTQRSFFDHHLRQTICKDAHQQEDEASKQEKDAKVEARFAAIERQISAIREDTDKLQKLLAEHPDDRVRMLLNSISSNLQGDLSKTIDDAQALHEMTSQAKESLNEFNFVKSACTEKFVSEEIKRAAAELRMMSGNDMDTLILIIINGFRYQGWANMIVCPADINHVASVGMASTPSTR